MKRLVIGLVIGLFLGGALSSSAAPSLALRLKSRILLAVEDKGKTYYVAPDGYRSSIIDGLKSNAIRDYYATH